jgi:hypothetical protein
MDLFILQLLIIFVPGMVWERIDAQYGRDRVILQWDILRRTFVFGLAAHSITFFLYWCVSLRFVGWEFQLFELKKDSTFLDARSFRQIGVASAVALVFAILWLYATRYKWITRALQAIGATRRYGDEDVWEFMFNSGRAEVEYVHLRDFDKRIVYAGWVEIWSESERRRELVLRDVLVYDFDGHLLFDTPHMYLAREKGDMDIELPYRVSTATGEM